MSVAPAIETYTCPVEGCDFAFTGDPDTVKFERRQHELVHDVDEFFEEKAQEPERTIGSEPPRNGKTATDLANEERQILLAKTITVRCMDCPDLEWTGPAREARLGWAEHRRDEHDDDTAMRSVDRMDRTLSKRDMQRPLMPGQNVDENLAKTRLQGGGHGVSAQANGDVKPRGYWTRERVIEAIQEFYAEHGREPTSLDLKAPMPTDPTVRKFFATRRAAVEAAGIQPAPRAKPGPRREAVPPPPVAEPEHGHDQGRKQRAIAPEPAPAQAFEGTPEGTLVELAKGVEQASEAVTVAEAGLADARRDLCDALAALGSALEERQADAA